jgi:hypothetical protein
MSTTLTNGDSEIVVVVTNEVLSSTVVKVTLAGTALDDDFPVDHEAYLRVSVSSSCS